MTLVHERPWVPSFWRESPWYAVLESIASSLPAPNRFPTLEELERLHAASAQASGVKPLRFTPYVRRKRSAAREPILLDTLYDGSIALRGAVPTRLDDWHDFFNALCFARWPRAKHALHARQYAALAARLPSRAHALPNTRTREQDALTLFDEGGALIATDAARARTLWSLDRDALEAQLSAAMQAGTAVVLPFGHALFEHWIEGIPCPGATARCVVLPTLPSDPATLFDVLDRALAATLHDVAQFQVPHEARHVQLDRLPNVQPVHQRAQRGTRKTGRPKGPGEAC